MFLSISVILLVITILATPVFAAKPDVPPGGPLNELWDALNSLQQQIEEMVEESVSVLQQQIDEINGRLDDLQAQLDNETSARQAADVQLQENIDAEEAARIAVDNNLQSQIDGIGTPMLGAWESKSLNTVYQADTDGFVVAWSNTGQLGHTYLIGHTDDSNPPTTVRVMTHEPDLGGVSFTMPVRSGDYWKAQGNEEGNWAVDWLPFGN